jgi:Spy/CpxP family protein refolding chaperone
LLYLIEMHPVNASQVAVVSIVRVRTFHRLPRRWLLAAASAAALASAFPAAAQGFRWWQDEGVQRRIGLAPDQSRHIEEVFQNALPELRRGKRQLDTAEGELSRLADGVADDAVLAQHVERVEAARAELNKTRTLMLLRMRRILSADQRSGLDALHRQRETARAGVDKRH